ncbi:hypothetical protein C3L33_03376, partial [Rhododendron williamsianum]
MYLKKAFWSDSLNSDPQTQSPSPVGDVVNSLDKQRLYREITLALRTGLKDARAEFSFLRVRGLRSILKFLRSVAESDSTINLFCHSQSIPDLQGSSLNSDPQTQSPSPVGDVVNSLDKQRLYREITLALRTGLKDARAEFSFLRVRGLRSILKFLRSVAESDSTINLFCHSQSIPDLQVVPVLFQHSLKELEEQRVVNLDHIFGTEPIRIITPSTDSEVALALRVLEGCCLLHRESTLLAHQHKAIQIAQGLEERKASNSVMVGNVFNPVLMNILSTRGVLEQGACLDALISIMLDSSANQMDFEACNGIEEVAILIKDKQVEENLRLKCGEFLLLLIGHVNGRERSPMAAVHEDIRRLMGEKSASLIWAASQFGSTLDPEQRLMALHIQARRVLESLDLY